MKKMLVALVPLALLTACLHGYTFRICYSGSDDPEVTAPDSITVNSVIHGGSMCWADNFSGTVNKGEYKDIIVMSDVKTDPVWNCHIVPETVNGLTIRPSAGSWTTEHLQGPGNSQGETWLFKKTKPVIETYSASGLNTTPITISIEWFVDVQDGLQEYGVPAQ